MEREGLSHVRRERTEREMTEPHIHDCTGPTATCPCGYVFRVPPVHVSISVGDASVQWVDEGFNCENLRGAVAALRDAADKLEMMLR